MKKTVLRAGRLSTAEEFSIPITLNGWLYVKGTLLCNELHNVLETVDFNAIIKGELVQARMWAEATTTLPFYLCFGYVAKGDRLEALCSNDMFASYEAYVENED